MSTLTEGQLATVAESMARVSRAERYIESTVSTLRGCKVFVDDDSYANVQYHLDQLHAKLSKTVLDHLDTLDGRRA